MKKTTIVTLLAATFFSSLAIANQTKTLEKDNFEGEWPFSFSKGTLECDRAAAFIRDDESGQLYGLNGPALTPATLRKNNALPLEPEMSVWLNDPSPMGYKVSLGDVLDEAVNLCVKPLLK
ncbi:DUF2511 domain-containing protein [Serratia marcescens]|uniref:DUF2511 domain-containing protein n=1 Tax=Serratia sp. 506_PEND TaxID=1572666 RepID=UPI00065FE537|nr:DUF2511 domain-containing protein [Serratia sp. 506_PEND]MBH2974495.1 DUF2511 domain-containing protein [Serratia marcescens]